MRLVIKQVKTKTKFTKYSLHHFSQITKWQLGVSLSLTSAAVKFKARLSPRLKSSRLALGCRRQAHAYSNLPTNQTHLKRENESAAKTGFALTRSQRPVFIAARFYRLFYFPLTPCFSFSERPLWHGSSRKSTAEKLSRKTFIYLICNSSTAELFLFISH